MIRFLPLIPLVLLAACGGREGNNASAGNSAGANRVEPVPTPTGPPPLTPRLNVPPQGNNAGAWLGPREPTHPEPTQAPYANLLDAPVVNGHNP